MTQAVSDSIDFLGGSAELERKLKSDGPAWLTEFKQSSRERFEAQGLPTAKDEAWRNTSVSPLLKHRFSPANNPSLPDRATLSKVARLEFGGPRLTFVEGNYSPELSQTQALPDGVWIGSMSEALEHRPEELRRHLERSNGDGMGPFGHLNGALLGDGAVVLVSKGVTLTQPVDLLYLSGDRDKAVQHLRTLIVAEEGSSVTVIERFIGTNDATYFTNSVADVVAGANASVNHTRVQLESPRAFHIAGITSTQGRDSRVHTQLIDLGGSLVRNDVRSILEGEGGWCQLSGLYLTHDAQHIDNHTTLDHAAANCDSRELFKGILDDRSRTIFTGRIIVRPDSQKTDAKQSNPNLLLSRKALAHTRPQLEIYADDVKCTHGATIGRMDEDAIFYLRSRGIDRVSARNMLVHAFAGEVLETLPVESLRDCLEELISERLERTDTP